MKRIYCALLAVLAASAAQAGPREDVMSNSSRCLALADDKAWLDCYLAAARPMQAALAGTPVPQAPRLAAAAPLAAAPVPMRAVRRRQGFFTRMFGSDVNAPPAPVAPAQQQVASAAPQEFGLRAAAPPPLPENTDRVTARMASYTFTRRYFTVTLDNGQVWQQIDGDTAFAPLTGPAGNYIVTIRRGLLGSYNFTIKGIGALYRVNRIR